ncbi:MAG TPA: cytochrome c3 family protein [Desulfobacterales bacterium]|jgi:hypothetical protein|nr:cytochrome c3 family protein [Desulfobacterales bacterium]
MENRALKAFALLALAALALVAGSVVYSQEDVATVRDSAFGNRMRPAVPFLHDDHNENAGIDECNVCHHVVEDGQVLEDESSEDLECSECHLAEAGANPIELVAVYHLRCGGCHREQLAGPVMCAECHPRN